MKFRPLRIEGAYLIEMEPVADERGWFVRTFCRKQLLEMGLQPSIMQISQSFNARAGTLRGLHYQTGSAAETKIVSCIRGSAFDVMVDLRPNSSTYCNWVSVQLDPRELKAVYIPHGVAHGFQTLEDDTVLQYQISEFHCPTSAAGVRWNDRAFDICWPAPVSVISERDCNYPDYVR